MTSPARVEAVVALGRIMESGAYSNVLVAKTEGLSPEEHAHFQRLVYSTLRWLPYADRHIAELTRGRKLDRMVRAVLRTAIIDSSVLGTPDHAVVDEYVESTRAVKAGRAAGFVNAVLRSFLGSNASPPSEPADSYSEDLIGLVTDSLGDAAAAFLEASNEPASVGLWMPGGDGEGDTGVPGCWYLPGGEEVASFPDAQVIDPASAAVAIALGVRPGDQVLDVAAAPGGKTAILKRHAGDEGMVAAADIHARRLRTAKRRVSSVQWVNADGTSPPFKPASFDAVLLDAPCTGLGTLRRRPEIRHRVRPDAPQRYGTLQRAMLEASIALVRPGGRLVYSVCTVTREETTEVTDGLGFRPPEGLPGNPFGDGLMLRPDTTGTDGMFIAVLEA